MSFFHNRSVFGAPDDDPDVVHLDSYGCDVHFSHYDRGTCSGPHRQTAASRILVIKGQLVLQHGGVRRTLRAGDWFDMPLATEYRVDFVSDCSLIEFCFGGRRAH